MSGAVGIACRPLGVALNADNLFNKEDYFLPGHFSNLVFPGQPITSHHDSVQVQLIREPMKWITALALRERDVLASAGGGGTRISIAICPRHLCRGEEIRRFRGRCQFVAGRRVRAQSSASVRETIQPSSCTDRPCWKSRRTARPSALMAFC